MELLQAFLSAGKVRQSRFNHRLGRARLFKCRQDLTIASPNDIHNSEKLRNPFWSGSAILNAAPLYVSCKNPHPQSKFWPIA